MICHDLTVAGSQFEESGQTWQKERARDTYPEPGWAKSASHLQLKFTASGVNEPLTRTLSQILSLQA